MAFRRLSFDAGTDLDENDEAEKEDRRSRASSSSNSSNVSTNSMITWSPEELKKQIFHILELNATNKINEKNAFQLNMINFLVYTLRKSNSMVSNFQMASACLDASSKIYGSRIDKVHSDLLKVVSGSRGEKRAHKDDEENLCGRDANSNIASQPKRKRRRKNCLSTAEQLKGNVDTYCPLSMVNSQVDVQTSDCLHQARLPKHASEGIFLNMYDGVVLDRIPVSNCNSSNFLVPKIEDFLCCRLCPSYDTFKFLDHSVNDEPMDTVETHESDGEYHFNMDDPIVDDHKSNNIMDSRGDQDQNFDGIEQQPLIDFQDVIANNPNPDATYEYSYLQENDSINLIRPSHWRVHIKRNLRYCGTIGPPKKKKTKKRC